MTSIVLYLPSGSINYQPVRKVSITSWGLQFEYRADDVLWYHLDTTLPFKIERKAEVDEGF